MKSKELVEKAINFGSPERIPFTGSMAETDYNGDTVALMPDVGGQWWLGDGGYDEWGCLWEADPDHGDMGQVANIVVDDINDLSSLKIPDASDPQRYIHWHESLEKAEKDGKYVVCCNGSYIFERAHFLHGFENTMMDMALEPDAFAAFLEKIAEYQLKTLDHIGREFRGRIHGYRCTDDWGTQTAPLISPATFADLFLPIYKRIFDRVHELGMDVWMHSCGQVLDILPLLIEAGLNVVNFTQPNIFPIEKLSEFKGKVAFEMCADEQTTLISGDKNVISAEIAEILANCATPEGGFIEMTLNRMHFEGDGIPREIGDFCHSEYRRLGGER
jgi:hypothetical protein